MLSQNLTLERNAIGVLLMLTGTLNLITGIYAIHQWLVHLNNYIATTGGSINYFFFLENFHRLLIVGALLIASGILLCIRKKSGWTISVALIGYHCISFPITITRIITDPEKIKHDNNTLLLTIVIFSVLVLLYILSFVIMTLPKFRTQFNTGPKQYWIALALFVILQLDRIIF